MKIALLGFGTVGSGVYEGVRYLNNVEVSHILDRHLRTALSTNRFEDIMGDSAVELVVEAMGGLHPAYEYAVAVLQSGRHFVTANKQLVSACGKELVALARKHGVAFLYSAACGGGIPFLSNLAAAHSSDCIAALGGILNGTTNYILDAMTMRGADYLAVLSEAQMLGYAERDPSGDVEGFDTMRKLVLACAVGLGVFVREEDIPTFGISRIMPADIANATRKGCVLKLCASAAMDETGLSACVEPTLISQSAPEAAIHNNLNYAWYCGEACGKMNFSGQGAGKLPTASNILRDITGILGGQRYLTDTDCHEADVRRDFVHRYCLRVPEGTAVPENWIGTRLTDGKFDFIETVEVPVWDMHAFAKENPRAFFAGIRKD